MAAPAIPAFPEHDFTSAARAVLSFLHNKLGFNLWMVTRTEGDNWIVLDAEDHGYGVEANSTFKWSDSFCSRMVSGRGPRFAPRSASIPAYAEAPIGRQLDIGAYIGVPISGTDGSLFGTLCAIDPLPQPEVLVREMPLIELLASLLSSVLGSELKATAATRRAELARFEADTDSLTGLFNRRAWDRLLALEEERCRRYGNPACVVAIDLDGLKTMNDSCGHAAGDQLLVGAAEVLRLAVRETDVVSRVGGDEFAVLAPECDSLRAGHLATRISTELQAAGIGASLGFALRSAPAGLRAAWEQADERMYTAKQGNKSRRAAAGA